PENPAPRHPLSGHAPPAAVLVLQCRTHPAEYAWHSAAAVRRSLLYRHHSVRGDPEALDTGISAIHWTFFFSVWRTARLGFRLVGMVRLGLRVVGLGNQAGIVLLDRAPFQEVDGLLELEVI